jgi:S1-C subfamily serine protease
LGWWFWRWDPFVGRYYQFYDRNYYGGYANAYPSYGYEELPVAEQAALGVTFNQSLSGGAYVATVLPGSPAEQGGLLPGDVIVGINGGPISSYQEVTGLVAQSRVGDQMQIDFLRGGQRLTATVALGPRSAVFR